MTEQEELQAELADLERRQAYIDEVGARFPGPGFLPRIEELKRILKGGLTATAESEGE